MRPEVATAGAGAHAASDSPIDSADVLLIDDLLGAYPTVVDGQDWQAWPDLFAAECSYVVYSMDNVDRGLPLAYMYDDNRSRLLDRVKFITEVWAGTIETYRTRHLTQRTLMRRAGPGQFRVESNVLVGYTEVEGRPAILTSGRYDDVIVVEGGVAKFASRTVYLDGTPARYLVYPL